jgi:hypothetical protein
MPDLVHLVILDAISGIRIGPAGSAEIVGTDYDRTTTVVRVKSSDINAVAGPMACAGAAVASPNAPPTGAGIGQCHLPVVNWQVGPSPFNAEPILRLTVSGGLTLAFQFSAQDAQACARALEYVGRDAALRSERKPN